MLRITKILTGKLGSKIELVDTPDDIRDPREANTSSDKANGKRHVTADVAGRNETNSW